MLLPGAVFKQNLFVKSFLEQLDIETQKLHYKTACTFADSLSLVQKLILSKEIPHYSTL